MVMLFCYCSEKKPKIINNEILLEQVIIISDLFLTIVVE